MKNKRFVVENSCELFGFLREKLVKESKNNIKSLLTKKHIYVNGKLQTKHNYILKENDLVEIKTVKIIDDRSNIKLDIIYEDNDIISINKPSGILTIATNKEKEKTAYHLVMNYLKKQNKNNKIFIVHRLDKDTSGVLLFAKNEKIKRIFQNNWNDRILNRKYYAIVEGTMKKNKGLAKSYLKESKDYMVYSSNDKENGKLAITEYEVIKTNDKYTLLDIDIKTGRKNQIRVHMSDISKPIVGDKKYGSKINPINRLALHAYELQLIDPRNKKILKLEAKMPTEMQKIL